MNKIAYISSPHFADCDMPLLKELQKKTNVTYILKVSEQTKKLTLINIDNLNKRGSIIPFRQLPELKYLSEYVNLDNSYIVPIRGKHDWSLCNLITIVKLLIFLIRKQFNIIHLTWPPRYGEFALYFLCKKIILTVHDPLPHTGNDNLLEKLHRFVAFHLIDHFILLNKRQVKPFVEKYQLRNKNIYLSKLGIYSHLLKYPTSSINEKQKYILFFGYINKYKGLSYLCNAIEQVHLQKPNVKLIIAGKGNFDFDIHYYIKNEDIVLMNDYIPTNKLVGLIRNCQFVVCPYTDATQSGVIMSAFSLCKPVLATNTGGIPEMMCHNRHGLIVPPKDSKALSFAILSMWDNADLLASYAQNIHTDYHGSGVHSWECIANGIYEIYDCIAS